MVKSFLQRRSGLVLKPEQGRGLVAERLTGPSPHTFFQIVSVVARILHTSLGPNGMDKMLQSLDGNVTIRLQGWLSKLLVTPDPKRSLSDSVRVMRMKQNPNGEKEAAVLCRAEVNQQVLNPSRHHRRLNLNIGSHSNSRDLRDLRLLGDSPPSLWCRNLFKSNARVRFHYEHPSKTISEIMENFPLFIKTIFGSFLFLQVQDSYSVF
jgi:hypothetical protein